MEYKKCKQCGENKTTDCFYKAGKYKDKYYLNTICKQCDSARRQEQYFKNWDRDRKTRRDYYKNNREKILKAQRLYEQSRLKESSARKMIWKKEHPEIVKVHNKVQNALRNGTLKKPVKCGMCGSKKRIVAHHEDYSNPLEVKWICDSCHLIVHNRVSE